jgi:tRNA splicing ligase
MLYKDEKRELIKIKAKPSIVELANTLYSQYYPFSVGTNLDDLFEQLITLAAFNSKLPDSNNSEISTENTTNDILGI